jgi:hypothetical protein
MFLHLTSKATTTITTTIIRSYTYSMLFACYSEWR